VTYQTTHEKNKQAILDTVKLFEILYEETVLFGSTYGKVDSTTALYKKEHYIKEERLENNCYLCQYSWEKSGYMLSEMCEICPCTQYLGKKCFELNIAIGSDLLNASTIKWGLRNAYKIASLAKVDCDFKYWKQIRYSRSM